MKLTSAQDDVVEEEMDADNDDGDIPEEEDADVDVIEEVQTDSKADTLPTNTLALVAALTQPLLALSQPTPLSFPPQPIHPPTASALTTIHIRALECLNNLFLGITADPSTLPEGTATQVIGVWRDVWTVLVAVGKQSEWTVGSGDSELRKEIWEIAVGVLWGLARIGKGELVSLHLTSSTLGRCT